MNNYNPMVSIVIPAYNGSNYLGEAIDSALSQTYKNIEIIVVNDGSSDDGKTEKIALAYGDKIRYFRKENGGSSSALNYGIKQMKGEWFSWLSHDDLYYPEKIEKQIDYIRKNRLCEKGNIDKHIFFSASENVNSKGQCIRKPTSKAIEAMYTDIEHIKNCKQLIADPIKYCFNGCSCLIHKNAFDNIGLFDEKLRLVNDIDMWFRLYSGGYILHYIPEILVKGRVHAKQISRSIGFSYHNPEQDMFWQRSLDWLEEHCDPITDYDFFHQFGKVAYEKTRFSDGKRAFKIAWTLKPKKRLILEIEKTVLKGKAELLALMKKIYLQLKV